MHSVKELLVNEKIEARLSGAPLAAYQYLRDDPEVAALQDCFAAKVISERPQWTGHVGNRALVGADGQDRHGKLCITDQRTVLLGGQAHRTIV